MHDTSVPVRLPIFESEVKLSVRVDSDHSAGIRVRDLDFVQDYPNKKIERALRALRRLLEDLK